MHAWSRIIETHIALEEKKPKKTIRKETKRCTQCNRFMSLSDFYTKKETKDGLRSKCKECYKTSLNRKRKGDK